MEWGIPEETSSGCPRMLMQDYAYTSLRVAVMIVPRWLTHRQTAFDRLYY